MFWFCEKYKLNRLHFLWQSKIKELKQQISALEKEVEELKKKVNVRDKIITDLKEEHARQVRDRRVKRESKCKG